MNKTFFAIATAMLSCISAATAQRIVMAEFPTASTGKQYAVILDAGWFDGILYYDYDIEAETNAPLDGAGIHVDMEDLRKFRNAAGRLAVEFAQCVSEADASGQETFSKEIKVKFPSVSLDLMLESSITRTDPFRLVVQFSREQGKDTLLVGSVPTAVMLHRGDMQSVYDAMTVYWAFSSVEEINTFAACLAKELADEVTSRIKDAEKENIRAQRQAQRPLIK